MSSRERKRAERRKRKQRSGAVAPAIPAASSNGDGEGPATAQAGNVEDLAAEAEARGVSRSEIRNEQARDELEPLDEGERPRVVTVGALISAAIGASIVIAWLAGAEADVIGNGSSERPNAFQVFPPAILFGVMSYGMWRTRYWAVLGFQAVMAIIMIGAVLALIGAASVFKALSAGLILLGAGALFWFTVKALARIQMPEPAERRLR